VNATPAFLNEHIFGKSKVSVLVGCILAFAFGSLGAQEGNGVTSADNQHETGPIVSQGTGSEATVNQLGARLAQYSPFLAPLSTAARRVISDDQSIELRGIMTLPEETRYCIYDPKKKSCVWVGVREAGYSFLIESADPRSEEINVLADDGRTLSLRLRESRVSTIPSGDEVLPQGEVAASPHEIATRRRLERRRNINSNP
jgi:hypothetical protein